MFARTTQSALQKSSAFSKATLSVSSVASVSSQDFGIVKRSYGSKKQETRRVTLIPGDGIGTEIADSVMDVFAAANVPIEWDIYNVSTEHGMGPLLDECVENIKENKVGLKGPLGTPIGKGHVSLNITLRKKLKAYANVRPCVSVSGVKTKYDNVDLVTIRENTEGEYSGIEHLVVPGVAQSIKLITREASMNICEYAFDYTQRNSRKSLTVVHKSNIMRQSDGMFLECFDTVAKKYPDVKVRREFLDNAVLKLASDPTKFDVMVMPNLYGDIISDLCAGLIGGLGLTGSGNIGAEASMFEAVHGTAPDIAGKNLANPTALLFSSIMMLKHMDLMYHAKLIEDSIHTVLNKGKVRTGDIGGSSKTTEYTAAIVAEIKDRLD